MKQIQVIREGQEGQAFQPLFSRTTFPIFHIRFAWLACNMFSATSNAMLLITLREFTGKVKSGYRTSKCSCHGVLVCLLCCSHLMSILYYSEYSRFGVRRLN